jgi:hypothetical protein
LTLEKTEENEQVLKRLKSVSEDLWMKRGKDTGERLKPLQGVERAQK